MAGTEYIVFMANEETAMVMWLPVGKYSAVSADAAKGTAALDHGDGLYAAVPARSWQPTAFKVQPRAVAVKQ